MSAVLRHIILPAVPLTSHVDVSVHQGGNVFAALSQGQSDEDEEEDLDDEDKPTKEVRWRI